MTLEEIKTQLDKLQQALHEYLGDYRIQSYIADACDSISDASANIQSAKRLKK